VLCQFPFSMVGTPGAIRYKGQRVSTACVDVLMSTNADLNSDGRTYLEIPLFWYEIKLKLHRDVGSLSEARDRAEAEF
jgi:hypothetical protein